MFSKRNKWLVLLLSLLTVSELTACPTKTDYIFELVRSPAPFGSPSYICSCTDDTDSINIAESSHIGLGSDFFKPPVDFTGAPQSTIAVQPLPAVPGALLLALTGFFCVSLVRDRRVWLAAVSGLIWVGQAGIQSFPYLAMRLGHRMNDHHRISTELLYPYFLENSRLRSDIEGSSYIGLLRHLEGIPSGKMPFLYNHHLRHAEDEVRAPQYTLIEISSFPVPVIKCLTLKARQFICFSPAFIFQNLPRAPPILA